ncbi:MAG: GTP-binding protein [Clostridiales bacterium]|nr:GTP-binding protein [Clostridiales bacterium]
MDFFFGEYFGDTINLKGTTLATQPISLFHQPRELIQAYYDAPKVTINDAKVIFLGDGGVGKTRTIKRLLNGGEPGDYPTELTPGIEITDYPTTYEGHPVDLRIWDFGGQEIMHAMHRCFLTDRTCYVVMVSNRFGNRTQRARYWLKTIDSFAKNCPVILAVNLWDTDEGIDGVNGELLEQEFPNVKKIIPYSAKGSDKDHFNRLTEAIVEQASRLDSCGMEFPESWANIRADLSKWAEKDRYISKADYLSICAKNGETDPQICGWLLEWFNDLGVCFSYHTDKTSGQELEDYQVLDPRWLVNAVYLIINDGRNYAQQSCLPLKGVWNLLKTGGGTSADAKYEESECTYILEVMRKFRLAYQEEDEKLEFIPALCPDKWEDPPQTKGWDSHVTYEMRYKYLPDSVLHQLMIYGKDKLKLEQAWSGGMELSNDKDRYHAVIYLRAEDSTLEINAYAKDGRKPWELLEDLRSELERINKDLNLEAEDVIVMQKKRQTAHFPVAAVLKAKKRNIPTLYAMDGGELEEYRVDEILGAAFDMDKVDKEKEKAKEENRPMSEKNMSGGNTYVNNYFSGGLHGGQNFGSTVNNYTSEDAKELLQQFLTYLERRDEKVEALLTSLMADLRKSQEPAVQELVAEVDDTAKKKGLVPSFIGAFGKALEVGANVATFAPFIYKYAPQIASAANTAANTLSGFLK